MRFRLLLLSLSFLILSGSSGVPLMSAAATTVRGHVGDQKGYDLPGTVVCRTDMSGVTGNHPPALIVRTADAKGAFEITLDVGELFDLCAMMDGFTPVCRKLYVSQGKTVKEDFRLKLDPLATKYVGTYVPRPGRSIE